MRKRIDLCVLIFAAVDATETGEGILAVDVHRARAADTLATRATKGECWIYFILDLDERIKNLGGMTCAKVQRGKTGGEDRP